MYKLDINNELNKNVVEVFNVPEHILIKLEEQLYPYIVKTVDGVSHIIIANASPKNSINLEGNILYINYADDNYLIKNLRRSLRDILYAPFIDNNYIKMHASAVYKDGDVYAFVGIKRAGKTSTALGLCKYCGYKFIGGDLSLIKDDKLLGWQTSIGFRKEARDILGIDDTNSIQYESDTIWMWPCDFQKMGYNFQVEGNLKKIIFPRYDFEAKDNILFPMSVPESEITLIANIHYEEINKENYWNQERTNIDLCQANILRTAKNIPAYHFISNGVNEENIHELDKILRRV